MANELSVAGPKAYGGLKPSCTIGAEDFASHDGTKSWGDDGAAEAMMITLAPEVRAYGAEQAKQAVLDYTQNAYADITVINGEICFLLDVSNDAVPYAVGWKLKDLLQKAMAEAENAADDTTLRAIGGFVEQLSATFRAPAAPPPRVGRPVRPGAVKPPATAARPAGGAQRVSRALPAPRPAS